MTNTAYTPDPSLEQCFHCNLAMTTTEHTIDFRGETVNLCCPACQSVMNTILSLGLENYYDHRENYPDKPEWALDNLIPQEEQYAKTTADSDTSKTDSETLVVPDIHCTACVWLIERTLNRHAAIQSCQVNYSTQRLSISWNSAQLSLSELLQLLKNIGYRALPIKATSISQLHKKQDRQRLRQLIIAGISTMQVMMLSVGLYTGLFDDMASSHTNFLRLISGAIATFVLLYSGKGFFTSAWRGLKNKQFNMEFPVSLALGLAYSFSLYASFTQGKDVYFDSVCMFIFFLLLGRYLEFRARAKTTITIDNLSASLPQYANLINNDGSVTQVASNTIKADNIIRVLPGEYVPVDGIILSGSSSVNESLLTGEPLPIKKTTHNTVIGGSTNIDGNFDMRVTHTQHSGHLSRISELLNHAELYRSPLTEWTTRIASYFILCVLIIACGTAYYWYHHQPDDALWIALSVLVVSCPCALSLAAPVAQTTATQVLSKQGFLIRDGHVLLGLVKLKHIIFDKTGTLTQGKFSISQTTILNNTYSETSCLAIAAALEQFSEHPLAKAFTANRDTNMRVISHQLHPSKGVEGVLDIGSFRIGQASFINEWHTSLNNNTLNKTTLTNNTPNNTIWLADNNDVIATFHLEDNLRATTKQTITDLHNKQIITHMLSGDPSSNAVVLGEALQIKHIKNNQSAEQKLAYLSTLKSTTQEHEVVAMVGDGVNDAPILAGADIAIAIGEGTDLARTTADAVLLNSKLSTINTAIDTALRAKHIVTQNITWAICYNTVMLPLAAMGHIPPYIAAAGMSFSSLFVVINALRLQNNQSNHHTNDLER